MEKIRRRSSRMHWLAPVAFALPLLAAAAFLLIRYGGKVRDILSILVKMAVIS